MTDAGHEYLHPGYKKPYPVETVLRDLAAQEGCDGEPYDAMVFAAATITTLRAQLAEARAEFAMARTDADDLRVSLRRAEAALAAPEVMREDAPAAIIGEIGNQIHNLGCELQNDEDVSLRLSDLACRIWDASKLFPTEPTALERMLAEAREQTALGMVDVMAAAAKEAREKALREAADVVDTYDRQDGGATKAILALIEAPK